MGVYLSFAGFKSRSIMPPADVDRIVRSRFEKQFADANAAAVTPETKFGEVVIDGDVVTLLAVFSAAVVADAVNFATISISKRTAGWVPIELGSIDTSTTDIPAGVPVALNVSVSALTAEDVLTATITKTGAGVILPPFTVDLRPTPNFVEFKIASIQALIEGRLRKRYTIPLDLNGNKVPETVLRWITVLVTRECYGRRGFNPTSEQDARMILDFATTTEAEIKEAADSKDGLFDLPLNEGGTPDGSGIVQPAPLGYAEASPFVSFDVQLVNARFEDGQGRGQ